MRQILEGRRYFRERFGASPKTAVNFDPFGHGRGLVQILAKAGYSSYVFCRPSPLTCPSPAEDFTWLGFDGSSLVAPSRDPSTTTPTSARPSTSWKAGSRSAPILESPGPQGLD